MTTWRRGPRRRRSDADNLTGALEHDHPGGPLRCLRALTTPCSRPASASRTSPGASSSSYNSAPTTRGQPVRHGPGPRSSGERSSTRRRAAALASSNPLLRCVPPQAVGSRYALGGRVTMLASPLAETRTWCRTPSLSRSERPSAVRPRQRSTRRRWRLRPCPPVSCARCNVNSDRHTPSRCTASLVSTARCTGSRPAAGTPIRKCTSHPYCTAPCKHTRYRRCMRPDIARATESTRHCTRDHHR